VPARKSGQQSARCVSSATAFRNESTLTAVGLVLSSAMVYGILPYSEYRDKL